MLHVKTLFEAAKRAGVGRIVHISITNPDRSSDLPYFSGKAEMEDHLRSAGISHCILRPTVLFGKEDITGAASSASSRCRIRVHRSPQ